MAEPTLQQIFGANASQTSTDLIIKKADFDSTYFTPSSSNKAEQLFVVLFQLAANYLNTTNQNTNSDIQITIEPSFGSITTVDNVDYKVKSYTISFRKPDTDSVLKASDF